MSKFIVPAQFGPPRFKVDRSMSLTFHTPELPTEEKQTLIEMIGEEGWLYFGKNEVDLKDIPKAQAEPNDKTPSQRLRSVLYVYWKQKGDVDLYPRFPDFYDSMMEKFIENIKEKLDK